jgi:hypothetical protein
MSKQNKVNPGQYYLGGRLTPDDMARERMKQQRVAAVAEPAPRAKAAGAPRAARTQRRGQKPPVSSRASSRRP